MKYKIKQVAFLQSYLELSYLFIILIRFYNDTLYKSVSYKILGSLCK
jgi:hypothetical protein